MIAQDQRLLVAHRAGHRRAALFRGDEISRLREHRHARIKDRSVIADRQKRLVERGKGDRRLRVRMKHRIDVRAQPQNLRMDPDFIVLRRRPVRLGAFEVP